MTIDPLTSLGALPRLQHASPPDSTESIAANGFATVLDQVLGANRQANAAAETAIRDLVTGKAQDVHTVTMAVAQADLSFRLILELRNRLAESLQEVTRMQI